MADVERVVLDTNVVLSGLLFPGGNPSLALLKAQNGQILGSDATMMELVEVMSRRRIARYLDQSLRQALVAEFLKVYEAVPIDFPIRACRDPKDDKFLEVAVHGRADLIVPGDSDLLVLNPFRGVAILTPAGYLARSG